MRRVLLNHSTRVLLLLFTTLLVLIAYFLVHSYYVQLGIHKTKVLQRLQAVTSTAALQIDGNQLDYLFQNYPNKDDITRNNQDKVYQIIQKQFAEIKKTNKLTSAIYTLTYDGNNGSFFFGVSSAETPFYRHAYDHFPENLVDNYEQGGAIDVYEDKNGIWLSAFAPIKNSKGETVAVIQADNPFEPFLAQARREIFVNIGISIVIVFIIFIFLFRAMRSILAKEEDLTSNLIQSKLELEGKNKETRDSILYAKRIQEAILPLPEKIQKSLPNSFVFYEPRDIVSGDFYWFKRTENKLVIAAVDCTGHGVSGAFMSIIGNNLLEDIICKKQVESPNEILKQLHQGVVKVLKQSSRERASRDGMDVALCVIDKNLQQMQFSGALRPLIHIRNGELFRIKSGLSPVGGFNGIEASFEAHEIQLQKGDAFYIYSDGFADQFGGKKHKKYMTKKFRDFLLSINKYAMTEQGERIADEFFRWKGELDQVDDVLVIGFEI